LVDFGVSFSSKGGAVRNDKYKYSMSLRYL
jgi:hypothetical protein